VQVAVIQIVIDSFNIILNPTSPEVFKNDEHYKISIFGTKFSIDRHRHPVHIPHSEAARECI